ncbi:tRNA pseudouridine(55) synthase TruB [Enterococcus italicus]|uniref:tRNA pseudouridine(55) synthase TruB n=1 Tax=Enterococcus italicus TaxID=246144 RepID=UPI0028AC1E5F|nr:tRNA pseudouridine(55) synthase TruB [Enterococcus italicus]
MDGILPLWKEPGMTSHDCVFKLRKLLQTKKIGHGGTLDPDVAGVLPIFIGKGTKVIEFLSDEGKVYEGEVTLGYSTTTEDFSGEVVQKKPVTDPLTKDQIDHAMVQFIGEITQIPPMYSAVKVAGKRLYEYARNNEEVKRPIRKATIDSFTRISEPKWNEEQQTQSWKFQVHCGKGTYIRTLAVDLGEALGYPAHMSQLTRLASGGFTKEQAITLAQVATYKEAGTVDKYLLPIEFGVKNFEQVAISGALWSKVKNGMRLSAADFALTQIPNQPIAIFYHEKVVSIYATYREDSDQLKPLKVIRNEWEDERN